MGEAVGLSVFAVDPGGTTGWAWAVISRTELNAFGEVETMQRARRSGRFLSGEVPALRREMDHARTIHDQMVECAGMGSALSRGSVPKITDILIEDFIVRERTQSRDLLSPVRLTSMLELLIDSHDLTSGAKVKKYSANDAKNTITNERLKRWGLYDPGKRHARDAVRHLMLHLRHCL